MASPLQLATGVMPPSTLEGVLGMGPKPQEPGATNAYGMNSNSKTYASDTFAAVTRQQWADYVNTFVPLENKLIQYATDPGVVTQAMQTAGQGVNASFDAQQASTQRQLKGLGVNLSPDEQAAQKRSSGLMRSLADVQAQNTANTLTQQRQQSIIGNPMPTGA